MRVSGTSTRGTKTALRVDQEHAGGDDRVTLGKPFANLDALVETSAERDGSGDEATLARNDEDVLGAACVDDRVARDSERRTGFYSERGAAVDARTKRSVFVLDREADAQRPSSFGQRWVEELDLRVERFTTRSWELEPGRRSNLNARNVSLGHLREHPDSRQVCDSYDLRGWIDRRSDRDAAMQDDS